jgi:hypothetical protein
LPTPIARTLFFVHEGEIVLLHGFIKKTRKTPPEDKVLAPQRKMHTSKPVKTRNKHRGSSFRDFLREDGMIEEVQAAALKRAVVLKVHGGGIYKAVSGPANVKSTIGAQNSATASAPGCLWPLRVPRIQPRRQK